MIKLTDDYLENRIEYSYLVSSLEGLLDASEIKDNNIVHKWYDYWGPLEIHNAISVNNGNSIIMKNVQKDIEAMREFLTSELKSNTRTSTSS